MLELDVSDMSQLFRILDDGDGQVSYKVLRTGLANIVISVSPGLSQSAVAVSTMCGYTTAFLRVSAQASASVVVIIHHIFRFPHLCGPWSRA